VGGNSKHLPVSKLASVISDKTKSIVLLRGSGTIELKKHIKERPVSILGEGLAFDKSVKLAANKAVPGDVVLLSPGFTSFAEFNNIFERGKRFKEIIMKIKSKR
jgi:UDP-N-acetylmuramoylalanine--D-glutamate ligase